jgi:hypothetical protein
VASKLIWLARRRSLVLALAVIVAAALGGGFHIHPDGLWDGPG